MDCHCIYLNNPVRFRTQADNGEEQTCRFNVKNNDKLFNTFSANKLPYQQKKGRHKIPSVKKSSIKNFDTGKIICHFLPTNFCPGYLKTLIELKH